MGRAGRQSCSEHADEAARLARRAATGEERKAYERIAAVWRDLAVVDAMGDAAQSDGRGASAD